MESPDRYWKAIEQKVCKACCDGDGAGGCLVSGVQECAMRAHFAAIVTAIQSVKSSDVQPYADAIRRGVCAACKHQSTDGRCVVRNELDCGLDRYLPLVIEAIEMVDSARRTPGAAGNAVKFPGGEAS